MNQARVIHLEVEDTFGNHSANGQVSQREQVAAETPAPIHVWFRPDRTNDVRDHILCDMRDRTPKRITAALAAKIQGIRDLGIAKPQAGRTSGLDSEMDPARSVDLNHTPERGQPAGKVDVLLPAIQRQAFVEAQAVLPHCCRPDRHIATVGGKCGSDVMRTPISSRAITGQDRPSMVGDEAWTADTIGKDQTGSNHDTWIFQHLLFDASEIVRIRQKIVIEEYDDVRLRSRFDNRITLAWEALFGYQHDNIRVGGGNALDIGGPGAANDNAVGQTTLSPKLDQRLMHNRGSADCWDTDYNIESHSDFSRMRVYMAYRSFLPPDHMLNLIHEQ
jgi:hypothetical protein